MILDTFFVAISATGQLYSVQASYGGLSGSTTVVLDDSVSLRTSQAAPIPAQSFVVIDSDGNLLHAEISPVLAALGSATLSMPITVKVGELGGPIVENVDVNVIDLDDFNQPTLNFKALISLDGVDVTASCLGVVEVEAEEGAARIANFKMRPPTGAVVIPDWVGKEVEIDLGVYNTSGALIGQVRVFTGYVDVPDYDPILSLVEFHCTDDFNNYMGQLTRSQIDAVVGGYWSPFIMDPQENSYQYFQSQLETVPRAVDMSPYRVVRTTDWAAKTTEDLLFDNDTIDNIVDGSLQVEVANRSSITNQVVVNYGFRFPRLKARTYVYSCNLPAIGTLITPTFPFVFSGFTIPSKQMVRDAANGVSGWDVIGINYTDIPPDQAIYGGIWFVDPGLRETLCWGASIGMMRRWAQTITEQYTITVSCPLSIAQVGVLASEDSGMMDAGEGFDVQAWESNRLVEPTDLGSEIDEEVHLDYVTREGYTRVDSDDAVEALIARAKTTILKSHRGSYVRFRAPINPVLDLIHTVKVEYDRLTAKGKVRHLVFSIDNDAGQAVMDVSVAISSVSATGVQTDDPVAAPTPPTPPTPPAVVPPGPAMTVEFGGHTTSGELDFSEEWAGYRGNYNIFNVGGGGSDTSKRYAVEFRVNAPDIEAEAVDPVQHDLTEAVSVAIPVDTLTLSAE